MRGRTAKHCGSNGDDDHGYKKLMDVWTKDLQREAREHNDEIMRLIASLGGSSRRYQRERRSAIRAVVSEVYSPARTTETFAKFKLVRGSALDLQNGWYFPQASKRLHASAQTKREASMCLLCRPHSHC